MAEVTFPEAIGITLCLIIVTMWIYEKTVRLVGPWGALVFCVFPPFVLGVIGYLIAPVGFKLYGFMIVVITAIILEGHIIDSKLMKYFPTN